MKKILSIAMLSMAGLSAFAQGTYKNPVYDHDFPDPSIQRGTDGTFYAYATNCQVVKSTDLVNWTYVKDVFGRPTWNDSTYIKNGEQKTDYYSLWASDVNYVDGKYIMYYASALWGNGSRTGIGVATGTVPTKFKDVGRLFRSTEIKVENSIDPCYIEEWDKKYLAWGSFNGIYIAELTADGLAIKDMYKKSPTKIAGTAFEGAMIHKRGQYYYLFASTGACCEGLNSTYETVVGRSTSLLGPYKSKGSINSYMLSNNRNIIIKKNANWVGPGHNSEIITDDEGQDWILYHAYDAKDASKGRVMVMDRLLWDEDGWPYVEGNAPSSGEKPAPVFYKGAGQNLYFKLKNADFMKSAFKDWKVTNEGTTVMESGQGSIFNPVMHVKDGSFSIDQTLLGLTEGLYELRLRNVSTQGGVDLLVGNVPTPANVAGADGAAIKDAASASDAFIKGECKQSAYGLCVGTSMKIGMMSKGMPEGAEYWAGNVEVIRRGTDDAAALAAITPWYIERGKLVMSDEGVNSYYRSQIESCITTLEKPGITTADQYKALVNIHKNLNMAKALDPDYVPTSITGINENALQEAQAYDLNGRRIQKTAAHRGIAVSKGRKRMI